MVKIFLYQVVTFVMLTDVLRAFHISNNNYESQSSFGQLKPEETRIATKLLEMSRDVETIQKEFQNAFAIQQDLMTEMSTGQRQLSKNRFVQLNEPANPNQIWRGLYDTQPMRSPPQMTVNVYDDENSEKIEDEVSQLATDAVGTTTQENLLQKIKEFEDEGTYERMNKEVQNHLKSVTEALSKQEKEQKQEILKPKNVPTERPKKLPGQDGPKQPPEPEAALKHPEPEKLPAVKTSGEIACAEATSPPVFREIDAYSNEQDNAAFQVESESAVHNIQVVSPFMPTVVEDNKEPELTGDEIPAGYYGESRVTL